MDGLEVKVSDISLAEWLPELAHRDIGVFEILHRVHGDDIASRCLELDFEALGVGQVSHLLEEILAVELVGGPSPIDQELARCLLAVKHIAHQGRELVLK